jgi:acetyl-CoA carboxylase beta subunit
MIDMVVDRREMKGVIAKALRVMMELRAPIES